MKTYVEVAHSSGHGTLTEHRVEKHDSAFDAIHQISWENQSGDASVIEAFAVITEDEAQAFHIMHGGWVAV